MNEVFVDTSAFLALLVRTDQRHLEATRVFEQLARSDATLRSSSYVLVETYALLQRRIGLEAVEAMRDHMAPLVEVVWVGRELHDAALERLSGAGRRNLSLVDCVSFEIMDRMGLSVAFAFDQHFVEQGFVLSATE